MGGFPGFGVWINQNTQQPIQKRDYDYIDIEEEKKQGKLWSAAERKHPWYDAPPRVKKNKSRKVLKKDGPRETAETEITVGFDFLWWSGAFP